MTKRLKLELLFFSGLAIISMVLLASSLAKLEFTPGLVLSLGLDYFLKIKEPLAGFPNDTLATFLKVVIFFSLVALPFALIYFLLSPSMRKMVLRDLMLMLPIFLSLYLLQARRFLGTEQQGLTQETTSAYLTQLFTQGKAVQASISPPQWLVLLVSYGVALGVILVIGLILRIVWLKRRSKMSLGQFAQQAQQALDALQAGDDLRNTVIRCYYEMSRVLRAQRGIHRTKDMTPREFESKLEAVGLPAEAVHQLTRLFETVRYGAQYIGRDEEQQAIASLTAIIAACEQEL